MMMALRNTGSRSTPLRREKPVKHIAGNALDLGIAAQQPGHPFDAAGVKHFTTAFLEGYDHAHS